MVAAALHPGEEAAVLHLEAEVAAVLHPEAGAAVAPQGRFSSQTMTCLSFLPLLSRVYPERFGCRFTVLAALQAVVPSVVLHPEVQAKLLSVPQPVVRLEPVVLPIALQPVARAELTEPLAARLLVVREALGKLPIVLRPAAQAVPERCPIVLQQAVAQAELAASAG